MLKSLVILGWLVLISGAWSQVPRDGSTQNQKPQGGQNTANPSQPLPTRVSTEVSAAEEKKSADSKPTNYPWHELYGPANIPNWFLVLLGAGGVFAAVRTLQGIRLQSNLMKEQLDRMVAKERARLKVQGGRFEVEGEPPGRWILAADLEIANHGPSKAYITQKRGSLAVVKSGESLPELDESFAMLLPYPFDIINPEVDPIHTAFYFEDSPYSLSELCTELAESRLVMYLYGFIEYETMGEGWHLPFRYRWEMSNIPDGMSERDLATDINILGGWDDTCSQENEERRINPN